MKMTTMNVDSRGTACPGPITDLIRDTAKENGWEIIALETMPDHVHLFIKTA